VGADESSTVEPSTFVTVPDASVPADLSISKNHSQHLLVSVARARELLDWSDEEQARDAAALRER
jgi:hypothetical protein